MKKLLLFLSLLTLPLWAQSAANPPFDAQSRVVLTQGIVGGIVAPVQSLYVIRPEGDTVRVWRVRPHEATAMVATLPTAAYQGFLAWASAQHFAALPVEEPRCSQDIYRRNTSIHLVTATANWENNGPSGCMHGQSMVQPNPSQRALFAEAVNRVLTMVQNLNYMPANAAQANAIFSNR